MNKNKFYVVWNGRKIGIFRNWDECKKSVKGFKDARYKSFGTLKEAEIAFNNSPAYVKNELGKYEKKSVYEKKRKMSNKKTGLIKDEAVLKVNPKSICVDASCSGSIGEMEYRGVWCNTRKIAFKSRKYSKATNNIGEFLAIVDAIKYLEKRGESLFIYSDSEVAIRWVRQKKANTVLIESAATKEIWKVIREAEEYLNETTFNVNIFKWDKNAFGENPADYGRKNKVWRNNRKNGVMIDG